MKYAKPMQLVVGSVIALLLITAVIAPISQYIDTRFGGKEILRVAKDAAVYLLFTGVLWRMYRTKPLYAREWLSRPTVRLSIFFVMINCVYAVVSAEPLAARLAGLLFNTRFIVWFLLLQLITEVYPGFHERFRKALIGLSWFLVVFGLVQIFILPPDFFDFLGYSYPGGFAYPTVDNDPNLPRFGATTRGPNELATFLVVALSVVAGLAFKAKQSIRRSILFFLGLVVLFFTYSRSAQLGLVVALGILSYMSIQRKRYVVVGAVVAVSLSVAVLAISGGSQTLQRIIFHDEPNSQEVDSNDQRIRQFDKTIEVVADNPLGLGLGSAGPASFYGEDPFIPDNYYAQLAVELGVVGLIAFIGLYVYVLRQLFRRNVVVFASGFGLFVVGLFLHVWVDDLTAYAWWGLAATSFSQKPRALVSSSS